MQSSRDSSVWRSLAVAFGDGVAFGVGMKLTQPQAAPEGGAPPRIDLTPLAHRIREIEQRMEALHQAPRAVVAGAGASMDQKVLEAVVNALDARLNEHASQVERRLTELEARIAIELKALDRQDQSIAETTQARLEEMQAMVRNEIAAIHGQIGSMQHDLAAALARVVEEQVERQVALQVAGQINARFPGLEQSIQGHVSAALAAQLRPIEQQLREEIRQAAGRATSLVGSAVDITVEEKIAPIRTALAGLKDEARQAGAVVEERLLPVRVELEKKGREIAELRERVGETDRSVLDMILSIGMMCRQTAERIGSQPPGTPPAAPAPAAEGPNQPLQASAQSHNPPGGPEPPAGGTGPSDAASAVEPAGDSQPGKLTVQFAETETRLWKIPLVSSLVLATGGLLLLHYL